MPHRVPAGSPSRGGDVKVYVLDINQQSLPTPCTLFLCLFLSYGPFTCISFHKFSRQLSAVSLCSPSLISALLALSTVYLFLKVSLNDPAVESCGRHLVRRQSFNVLLLKAGVGHTCYAYCQGFLPCLFLPFRSIHLHFSKTSPDFFLCWLWLTLVPV